MGYYKQSEEVILDLMEVIKREHPDDLQSILLQEGNLAAVYFNMGRMDRLEKLEKNILKGRQKLLGKKHPQTLQAMVFLASTYMTQNRFEVSTTHSPIRSIPTPDEPLERISKFLGCSTWLGRE